MTKRSPNSPIPIQTLPPGRALWWVVAALVLGAVLRVAWMVTIDTQPVTDFDWYYARGVEISKGLGYQVGGEPTAYWPVGYPAALGMIFSLVGASVEAAKVFNIFLSLTAIPLTFWLGERLFRSETAGIVGAFIVAAYPSLVAYSNILASEPLYISLTLLGILWLIRGRDGIVLWLGAGLALGLAALVRPQAALIPFLILPVIWLRDSDSADRIPLAKAAFGVALGMMVVMGPWLLRNHMVFGRFVFVSTNGGDNLLIGHHPGATGRYKNPDLCGLDRPESLKEAERDKAASAEAMENIRANPQESLNLIPAKLAATFLPGKDAAYWGFQTVKGRLSVPGKGDDKSLFKGFSTYTFEASRVVSVLCLLGFVGCCLRELLRAGRLPLTPLVLVGFTALLSMVFFGNPRFGLPLIPFAGLFVGSLLIPWTKPKEPSRDEGLSSGENVS